MACLSVGVLDPIRHESGNLPRAGRYGQDPVVLGNAMLDAILDDSQYALLDFEELIL